MSQARGSEEHSLKTCPSNGECAGKAHKGTASTLSWPASLHFHSVLGGTPKGISWHLSTSPFPEAALPRMPFPALCLGFILPFLSSLCHILSLWGSSSGTWESGLGGWSFPPSTLPAGPIPILLGPREGLGVSGCM